LHIPFGGGSRNEVPIDAVSQDSIILSPFCRTPRVPARFAFLNPSEPRQTNGGDMRGWRDAFLHWLIEELHYAAQAAAMREGHPWDITPRVALGSRDKCHAGHSARNRHLDEF
jgi:hypothetical protein